MSSLRPSAPRFLPGTILGHRYRVERLLAAGTKGMMLEATDLERSRPVAIKVLRASRRSLSRASRATPESAARPSSSPRFDREARIAGRLSSEHLAPACAFGHTDGGDPFLVTELLEGRDLAAELAARGPLPIAEAVDAVLEACAGVATAHAAGLVHRDLKPSNLFVVRSGASTSIKVLDFGLTRAPNEKGQVDLTVTESDFGTPQYLSPEQIRVAAPVDARTDQHALGAILYELCTGKPPFQAPDVTQLAVAIAVDPPPRARAARPEVPPALDDAIRRALGKRPDDRFPDLLAFAEAIAPFGGERGRVALRAVRAVEPSPPRVTVEAPPPRPRPRRSPAVPVLLSVIAMLGTVAAYRLAIHHAPAAPSIPAASPAGP